jgi:hypothetical protein
MSWILWGIVYFSVLAVITIVLIKGFHISLLFSFTFFFLGSIYLSAALWESEMLAHGNPLSYLFTLWVVMFGFIVGSYVAFYWLYRRDFRGREFLAYIIFLIGMMLLFGVLEDFLQYIIWGLDTFNPICAYWHVYWFYDLFPVMYWMGLPGLIMVIVGLYLSTQTEPKINLIIRV